MFKDDINAGQGSNYVIPLNPPLVKGENVLRTPRPEWLKVKAPVGETYSNLKSMIRSKSLHTVCEEARCPNMGECWSAGTATFMILGDICIRNCRFCAVSSGKPLPPDPKEPINVAEAVKSMAVRHAVITSVNRDELPDQGSEHWAKTILEVRKINPKVSIEVLIPDFMGDMECLKRVVDSKPDILNHNIETVPRLYAAIRPKAIYQRSLTVLNESKKMGMRTKSGLMVGIGEKTEEVFEVMKDLKAHNVDIVTIGQYLQPTPKHAIVDRFVHPDEFAEYKRIGLEMGFKHVESGPLVRSSYHAELHA
ncbi:MAG: lipoyl synthase [Bacteroidetes bacterium]|nr:lipoyl synthase [Bacteroidota bacterium]